MRTLLMLAAAALAVASPSALAGEEEEVVLDHWFAQFQKDKKSGWTHVRRVRTTRGGETVSVTEMQAFMEVGPQGQALPNPVQSRSRFVENEAGTVLEYETVVELGQLSQRRAGTVKGGTISFEDGEKKGTVAYPAGALGPVGLQAKLKAGLKPGAKIQALAFTGVDPGKGNQVTWTVPQQTTLVDVLGYHAWLYEVERRDSSDMPEKVLVDGAGTRWGGALNLGLIGFLRTEEVVARDRRDPGDWLPSRIVEADRVISASALRDRVVLRLSRAKGPVGDLPEGALQRVVRRGEDGSVDVAISAKSSKKDLVVWMRPYTGGDQDDLLHATPLLQLAHPRLKKYAEASVGKLQDGLSCARVLEMRVKQTVSPAASNVGWANSSGVLSSRKGDFTETAVLAAAAARSLGLPSRLVAGFVYWGPDTWPKGRYANGAFVAHVWAEIHAGEDLWVPVDPMRMTIPAKVERVADLAGHAGFDAGHVAVLRSNADTEKPFTEIVLPVLEFLDGLKVEVVEPEAQ